MYGSKNSKYCAHYAHTALSRRLEVSVHVQALFKTVNELGSVLCTELQLCVFTTRVHCRQRSLTLPYHSHICAQRPSQSQPVERRDPEQREPLPHGPRRRHGKQEPVVLLRSAQHAAHRPTRIMVRQQLLYCAQQQLLRCVSVSTARSMGARGHARGHAPAACRPRARARTRRAP